MDLHRGPLPYPVKPSDALLNQLGIHREIEQNEIVTELEIPAFASHFAADKYAGALFLGKPGRIAVALENGHLLMKHGDVDLA
jgi:hypothetical protein